jgi:AbrB family looped-hinge helix DNA binding protein
MAPGRETLKVILASMTYRVGPKGQVVIPKPIRDELGLAPGDDVDFSLQDDGVMLRRSPAITELRGRYRGVDLTGALLEERAVEKLREDTR